MRLTDRLSTIETLFEEMDGCQASNWQKGLIEKFRKDNPELNEDLDFCFEVLAGKHKLGYTMVEGEGFNWKEEFQTKTIKEFYQLFITTDRSQENLEELFELPPFLYASFWAKLCNREYRLGYSNKAAMVTNNSPMLAKKWTEERWRFKQSHPYIFIQEKYDGNRSVWEKGVFMSRRGKVQRLDFDMKEFVGDHPGFTFDGEVITQRGDFNAASGAINSKYGSKDSLVYVIYDIIDPKLPYFVRKDMLDKFKDTQKVKVAPILAEGRYGIDITDKDIDALLGKMVADGAEGIMIRIGDANYENKRTHNLLKYKLVQSMDMLCTDFVPGTGKYEGMIGSLKVSIRTRDGKHIVTYVGTGLKDYERSLNPSHFIGKIVEVEYFEVCKNKDGEEDLYSLRFPRFKGIRYDKTTTSEY